MGHYTAGLVGESKYQAAVRQLQRGASIELRPEPDNPHDPRAIRAVAPSGETIGYLERDSWLTRCILDEEGTVAAKVKEVVGGGRGRFYGVVLDVYTAQEAVELLERRRRASPVKGRLLALLNRLFPDG